MRFYIAGRFEQKEKVREIYKVLKEAGHELSADWTTHLPFKENPEMAEEYAIEDIEGVVDCDVFVLLTSEKTGAGSSLELGIAITLHLSKSKPLIYLIGDYMDNNLFYSHPSIQKRKTIKEVLNEV